MRVIGELFKPKASFEALKEELVPSFNSVLETWLGGPKRTRFADPDYVLEVTYFTQPLKIFIKRIVDRLDTFTIIGSPLERGFGFGKTHALILLWHIFTSEAYSKVRLEINEDIIHETLVLGMDYSVDKPFTKLMQELEVYTNLEHSVTKIKDYKLIQAIYKVLKKYSKRELYSMGADELARLLLEILSVYEESEGKPRLLLLIDELGWGIAQRLRRYAERRDEEIYNDVNKILNFLSYLYERLHGKAFAGVVIWVLAEQDRNDMRALAMRYRDNEILYGKINGVIEDLDNIMKRYSRGLGGTSIAELSYSPEHALEIARHRVLKTVEGEDYVKLREEYLRDLESLAKQFNLEKTFTKYKEVLRRHYPFSLGLIILMKKLMNPRDAPATGFVRTILQIAAKATENALTNDPLGAYTIGVKHLSILGAIQANFMGPLETEWVHAATDVMDALSKMEGIEKEVAEEIAKYILAKGVTANIITILESRDRREIEKYGSTINEIQLEILSTFKETEALHYIERLDTALDKLRAESARIDEREINGIKYYMPSPIRTIFSKLPAYIIDERKNIENKALIPVYIKQSTIPSLFTNIRVDDNVVLCLKDYRKIKDVELLLSDPIFQRAQNRGKLLFIIIPPWDMDLFNELNIDGKNYEVIIENIARRLQSALSAGKIKRHLHIAILIPDLTLIKLKGVLNRLVTYEGTKKFLNYLSRKEKVIDEMLQEYEETFIKRRDLLEILKSEVRRRELKLRSKLEQEIVEAKNYSQKELVRLSRELTASVLELYSNIIYYSLDKGRFIAKSIVDREVAEATSSVQHLVDSELSSYSSIVNGFISNIINSLAYENDAMKIARAVLDYYKKEFEEGTIRQQDRVDEVLENIMLGTYGIKPISLDVASRALGNLKGQTIELEDKNIKIDVDEASRLIKFIIETKVGRELRAGTASVEERVLEQEIQAVGIEETTSTVFIELPQGFDATDMSMRLTSLIQSYEVNSINIKLDTNNASMQVVLNNPTLDVLSKYKVILNLMSRISKEEGGNTYIEMKLTRNVPISKLKEILGDYLKSRKSTFDRFLSV